MSLIKPLFMAAGVRSWRTFVEGAQLVSIRRQGGSILLTPMINMGAQNGFAPNLPSCVTFAPRTICDIGAAIRSLW